MCFVHLVLLPLYLLPVSALHIASALFAVLLPAKSFDIVQKS